MKRRSFFKLVAGMFAAPAVVAAEKVLPQKPITHISPERAAEIWSSQQAMLLAEAGIVSRSQLLEFHGYSFTIDRWEDAE